MLFHGAYLCQADHTVCFVLEYMNANSLQHLLKRSNQMPMDEAVVSRVTQGILAGIGAPSPRASADRASFGCRSACTIHLLSA